MPYATLFGYLALFVTTCVRLLWSYWCWTVTRVRLIAVPASGKRQHRVIWQWEGDYADHYHDFDDKCQKRLEEAYSKKERKCTLPRNSCLPGLVAHVQDLYLIDKQTSFPRAMLRLVEPDCGDGKVCWQWQADGNGTEWVKYDDLCNSVLEAAFQQKKTQVDLELDCKLPYDVDLNAMMQINKRTSYRRQVRRLSATSTPALPPSTQPTAWKAGASARPHSLYSRSAVTRGSAISGISGAVDPPALTMTGSHGSLGSHVVKGFEKFVEIVHTPDAQDVCPICMEALTSPSAYGDPAAHSMAVAPEPLASRGSPGTATPAYYRGRGGRGSAAAESSLVDRRQLHAPHGSLSEASCVVRLTSCKHQLHRLCLATLANSAAGVQEQAGCGEPMASSITCPTCNKVYGEKTGTCPPGEMTVRKLTLTSYGLPGYDQHGVLEIIYNIKPGLQGPEHPHPGKPYIAVGFPRVAYLPDNDKGRLVLKLLRVAFDRRLTFTVGRSVTTGADDMVTWNEIHHKTSFTGAHGYPDETYLDRVIKELEAFGITESDLADP